MTTRVRSGPSFLPWLAFAAWLLAASALAFSGALTPEMPRPIVPALIFGTTLLGVLAYRAWPAFKDVADGLDLRVPIAYHAIRVAFGAAFLVRDAAGTIHREFARVAGPGDIVAGTLAVLLVLALGRDSEGRVEGHRRWVLAWSAIGLFDMLLVIATAQRIVLFGEGPAALQFFSAPYTLLPGVVVPLVLLTHLLVIARSARPWVSR